MMRKFRLNKRGVTLVEIVIAMAVITIVTVATISIITSSIRNAKTAGYKAEARYFASDALECFRATDSTEEFFAAIEFRGGYSAVESVTENGVNTYTYVLDHSEYEAVLGVSYADGNASFSVVVTDNADKVLAEYEFFKGDSV